MKKPIAVKGEDVMSRLMGSGSIKSTFLLSDSPFYMSKDTVTTEVPIINTAFSGDIDGGLVSGLTMFAGQSRTFKTLLGLYCMKAYLEKYPNAVAILYDSEFSITPEYLATYNIDPTRIIHVPIEHIEQLKFDIVHRLDAIKRGDKVFILVDSLGMLGSKKEIDDAMDEKSVADMTRAKAIRSLLRIITPQLTMKDIPCIIINHIYQTLEMFSKNIMSGGTAPTLAANQIFFITKAQEKDGDDLIGWKFTISIDKSRFVREKSKFSFIVTYEEGINKYSGILDLALENGNVVRSGAAKGTRYALVNSETGEVGEEFKETQIYNESFLGSILKETGFKEYVKNKFSLNKTLSAIDDEDDEILDIEDEDLELIQE